MKRVSRVAAVAALTLVGGTLAGTGVLAATGPSDEAALKPTRHAPSQGDRAQGRRACSRG